ncbi:hypothetical protein RQP46_003158 [Phenoliferia psychrophenolica]
MKPVTIADALALPKLYEIPRDIADEVEFYGPYLKQAYLQAWVNFQYNSYYVANVCTSLVKHLILSSGVGKRSLEPVQWLGRHASWATIQIPTRLHTIIISLYLIFNFIVIWTPYKALYPSLYWQELGYPLQQYSRFFADRTGIMSFGSTPLVVILAGRNSPISFLTGASFSTLQIYHRWVARVTFAQALFHALAWTLDEYYSSSFTGTENVNALAAAFSEPYWNWGCVAVGGGALLVAASSRRLREVAYEIFLIGHIVGAILWWLYASFALWGFDRVARLCRLLWLNLPSFRSTPFNSTSSSKNLAAEGYLVGTGDFLRLRVTMARGFPASLGGPGQYVFISSPKHKIWESHPFTITWPTEMPAPSANTAASTPSVDDESKQPHLDAADSFDSADVASDRTFELVLKSYAGFTRKLAKLIGKAGATTTEDGLVQPVSRFRLLVEGPYGSSVNLHHGFESILLVAGGSGISATISHLADFAKRATSLSAKRIVVVWAVRSLDVLLPYLLRLQSLLPSGADPLVNLHVYYTGNSHLVSSILSNDDKASDVSDSSSRAAIHALFKPVKSTLATITSHEGRPAVGDHIEALQPYTSGKIAVNVCGPTSLCDSARLAVRDRLGGEGFDAETLVYGEESFTW